MQTSETEITQASGFDRLCNLVNIEPPSQQLALQNFTSMEAMAGHSLSNRLTAGLQVFLDMVAGDASKVERIDKVLLDHYIAKIDETISEQLDAILHHDEFQQTESVWRGLKYLVDNTDFRANMKVELLDIDKESLREDFADAPDTTQSGLYKHIYVQEYDTPGGEPISAVISNYEFDAGAPDVALLGQLSRVAAAAHCPFIGTAGAHFFKKEKIDDVTRIDDLASYMDRAEYIRWNSFRETDDARYLGLKFSTANSLWYFLAAVS